MLEVQLPPKIIISEKCFTLDTYLSKADIGINLLSKVDLHYGLFINNF